MKLKYYLRGFGLGIILTAVIMIIVTNSSRKELSNTEIIHKAEELGMVMNHESKTTAKDDKKSTTVNQQLNDLKKPTNSTNQDKPTNKVQELVSIVVQKGEVSDTIADKLCQAGLVTDAKVFNKFLTDNKYDGILLTGTFNIPKGSTAEEIAKILTTKH